MTTAPSSPTLPVDTAGPQALRIETVRDVQALEAHAPAWNQLAAAGSPARPMFSAAWVLPNLARRPARRPWEVHLAWRGETLVGVLPLERRGSGLRTAWVSITDDHTFSGGPLVREGEPPETLTALLEAGGNRVLRLEGLVRGGRMTQALGDRTRMPAWRRVVRDTGVEGAYLPTTEPFDTLIGALTRKSRKNARAAQRKLEGLGTLTLDSRRNQEALDVLDDFFAVEASGWKHDGGTAIGDDETLLSYYRDLARRMAAAGWFELHLLRLDGKAIAGEFCVRFRGRLYLQKIAYDEAHARHSPGHVLWMKTIAQAAEDEHIVAVDTIGTDLIRKRWQCVPYHYDNVRLFPPTVLGRLRWPVSRLRSKLAEIRHKRSASQSPTEPAS